MPTLVVLGVMEFLPEVMELEAELILAGPGVIELGVVHSLVAFEGRELAIEQILVASGLKLVELEVMG